MGLDVYLKVCDDWEDSIARTDEYERLSEENYATAKREVGLEGVDYNDMTKEQRDEYFGRAGELNEPLRERLGLEEYGEDPGLRSAEIPNDFKGFVHPGREEHIFELGYFRSSYNGSGINNLAGAHGFPSLYDLFPEANNHDEYYLAPDWEQALARTESAIERLKQIMAERPDNVRVTEVSMNAFIGPPEVNSEEDALKIYYGEAEKWKGQEADPWFGSGYTNRDGMFDSEGVRVKGVIPGFREFMGNKIPCTYVIIENDEYDPISWCLKAYEMVKLTIEYVLEQEDTSKFRLAWSG